MNDIITKWLLPDLLVDPYTLIAVLLLVLLVETTIRPFLPFATDAAEINHNNTCNGINGSIKAIKTSLEKVESQATQLNEFLVRMSSNTIGSFNTDKLDFEIKYGNVRLEIETCTQTITDVSEEVKNGKISIKNDTKESDSDFQFSVMLLAVVMAVLGMLKSTYFFNAWIFDKGSWIAVGIYLNRTVKQRRKASKCYLCFKQKYADYERMLPPLETKRKSLLANVHGIDNFYTRVKKQIKEKKSLQEIENQRLLRIEDKKLEIEAQKLENEKKPKKKKCVIM